VINQVNFHQCNPQLNLRFILHINLRYNLLVNHQEDQHNSHHLILPFIQLVNLLSNLLVCQVLFPLVYQVCNQL
jgi:hypothetical protein